MELRIKTLTPLWTGGVEAGEVDRIHETGILGSLRWWYEVLVRGLGGVACDPTTRRPPPCTYDPDKPNNGLCDVCQVFGATGWRRRFRLTIEENRATYFNAIKPGIAADRSYIDARGDPQTPYWPFRHAPKKGSFTFHLQSLAPDFPIEVIAGLIQFTADWTALGARAQMGFGVIEPVNGVKMTEEQLANLAQMGIGVIEPENGRLDTRPLYDWLLPIAGNDRYPRLPSLQNLFLARIRLPKATERDSFNLKYDLRRLFAKDQPLRRFIMGTIKGERMAAKVKMSLPYGDQMRVWGWIPERANEYGDSSDRNAVVNAIRQHLRRNYTLQVWREMGSPRDTVSRNNVDAKAFLRNLLGIKEEDDAI